ncbi:MAG: hypothetical protein A3D52_03075 [Candidatus Taylorbacteria bacterium RIFCSPHIGHO2_02_FULL_44_36]|nr:MAG: hypothetical protein A3D52_03075 [Candidatus Taylorbacteria bacterium RIFCSPHIGHO2_02_FULL_44_36]OHA39361.1 MAG: hypothetical protein A3I97_00050 [Candidatus Taylorbacteria bacterium RIFCSPLOWO2_02_FULL_44_35]
MLTPYLNSQFVEKILTDRHGRQFRCLFLVVLVDGEIRGHLVSAKEISVSVRFRFSQLCENLNLTGFHRNFCLPLFRASKKIFTDRVWLPIVDKFIPKDFSFITCQMTRAPSF